MQNPLLAVRSVKLPRLKAVGIGPRTEICVNWGGQIAMIPCLHQENINMKRELCVWRDQKSIPLVGTKPLLAVQSVKLTPSQGSRYRTENGNLRKLGWTYRHGTVFAPREYLYQKVARGMERPEMYSFSRCKNPSYLCGPSNYSL